MATRCCPYSRANCSSTVEVHTDTEDCENDVGTLLSDSFLSTICAKTVCIFSIKFGQVTLYLEEERECFGYLSDDASFTDLKILSSCAVLLLISLSHTSTHYLK